MIALLIAVAVYLAMGLVSDLWMYPTYRALNEKQDDPIPGWFLFAFLTVTWPYVWLNDLVLSRGREDTGGEQ